MLEVGFDLVGEALGRRCIGGWATWVGCFPPVHRVVHTFLCFGLWLLEGGAEVGHCERLLILARVLVCKFLDVTLGGASPLVGVAAQSRKVGLRCDSIPSVENAAFVKRRIFFLFFSLWIFHVVLHFWYGATVLTFA